MDCCHQGSRSGRDPGAAGDSESGRQPVRYKTNDYSVPVAYGHCGFWIYSYVGEVAIGCCDEVIARHPRDER